VLASKLKFKIDPVGTETPVRVLYIVGCGRSGSTILDTILGNHPDVESVGEASHVARDAWRGDGYCACGDLGSQCAFWKDVERRWKDRVGQVNVADYVKCIREVETGHSGPRGLLRQVRWNNLRLWNYGRLTGEMLGAIRDASGKKWIVDSSKGASRALALAMIPGVHLRLIHLVRDCRGVAWSRKKQLQRDAKAGVYRDDPGMKVWRTAMVWNAGNMRASWVCRQLPERYSIRVRYEDLVSDPAGELQRIGQLTGLNFGEVAHKVTCGTPLSVGHTVAGNRLRMSGSVRLRPDVEWVDKLSAWDRFTCWAISGWLSRRYGYRSWTAGIDGDSTFSGTSRESTAPIARFLP
jgi:sulfotransferase family protein